MLKKKTFTRMSGRKIIHVAWPVVVANITQTLLSCVDLAMVGRISADAVAAVGTAGNVLQLFLIFAISMSFGMGIFLSIVIGRGEEEQAKRYASFGLTFGIWYGAALFGIATLLAGPILRMMNLNADVYKLAETYLSTYLIAVGFIAVNAIMRSVLNAFIKNAWVFYSSLIQFVLNVIGNYILIYGYGSIEPMGIKGAALASVLSTIVATVFLCVVFIKFYGNDLFQRRSLKDFLGNVFYVSGRIFRYGISTTFDWSIWFFGILMYTRMLGSYEAAQLALFHAGSRIQSVLMLSLGGIATANNVFVGRAFGTLHYGRIRMWTVRTYEVAFLALLPGAALLVCAPEFLFSLFFDVGNLCSSDELLLLGVLMAVLMFIRMTNVMLGASLRSMGVVGFFFYVLVGAQCIALVTAYSCTQIWQMGFVGVIIAMFADEFTRNIVNAVKLFSVVKKGEQSAALAMEL